MQKFRRVAIGEAVNDAVTVGIERNGDDEVVASVWWPASADGDGEEADYSSVPEALSAALAAKTLYGFAEVVVTLQSEDLWQQDWGELHVGNDISEDEMFELARATEASRDA